MNAEERRLRREIRRAQREIERQLKEIARSDTAVLTVERSEKERDDDEHAVD